MFSVTEQAQDKFRIKRPTFRKTEVRARVQTYDPLLERQIQGVGNTIRLPDI